jgi:hypothetical protein
MSNVSTYLPKLLRTFWCGHCVGGKYMVFEIRNGKFISFHMQNTIGILRFWGHLPLLVFPQVKEIPIFI